MRICSIAWEVLSTVVALVLLFATCRMLPKTTAIMFAVLMAVLLLLELLVNFVASQRMTRTDCHHVD